MSDQNTALPIRSEADGADERLHVKIVDGTTTAVNQMTVDIDKNAHVEIHGNDKNGGDKVVALSESGNVALDGDYDVATNTNPSSVALIAHDRNAVPNITNQNKRPTAVSGESNSVCLDFALHDENGQAYNSFNPLSVSIGESEGDEVLNYQTSSSVAKNVSVNHDYTIAAAKTFIGAELWISASGKIKVQLSLETAAISGFFNAKWVGFNSTANPNIRIPVQRILKQVAGAIVRITITNKDNQPQDVYSTLVGIEK